MDNLLLRRGLWPEKAEHKMRRRSRRNHTLTFKAKVALAVAASRSESDRSSENVVQLLRFLYGGGKKTG